MFTRGSWGPRQKDRPREAGSESVGGKAATQGTRRARSASEARVGVVKLSKRAALCMPSCSVGHQEGDGGGGERMEGMGTGREG